MPDFSAYSNNNNQSNSKFGAYSSSKSTSDSTGVNIGNVEFKGNLIGNTIKDLGEISSGITTLARGIFVPGSEEQYQLFDTAKMIAKDPRQAKVLADAVLSTYNLTTDDIGTMPFGEIVGNVMSGAWEHPLTTLMDVTSIASLAKGAATKSGVIAKAPKMIERDARIKIGEKVARENLTTQNLGSEFYGQVDDIAKKYRPEDIAKAMQSMETVGLRNTPKKYRPIVADLTRANDTYKAFVRGAGAELIDDAEFAATELLAKNSHITFNEARQAALKQTEAFQQTLNYVKENDVRPLFHMNPKIDYKALDIKPEVVSNLFKREFGTIDYMDAAKNLRDNSIDLISKVEASKASRTVDRFNELVDTFNKKNKSNIKKLEASDSTSMMGNRIIRELNSELKKTMLGSGVYLGANIVTTTLSILNHFNWDAAIRTAKDMPKFRLVKIDEAKTPFLHAISKLNNISYRPIASTDKYVEAIASRYIQNLDEVAKARIAKENFNKPISKMTEKELTKLEELVAGEHNFELLQSAIPTQVHTSNPIAKMIQSLIPFGSYPVAAAKQLIAEVKYRPGRRLLANQIYKTGNQMNQQIQQQTRDQVDSTKVIRKREDGTEYQTSSVITPIQAMNMFMLGTQGDAIQIPVYNYLNAIISGKGDPSVFEVNGKSYRVTNGQIETVNGSFSIIPALRYTAKNMLSPVQFYNQVITPLMTDKFIRDDNLVLNKMVSDSQYSNMSKKTQAKVTTAAREKLAKKLAGTYEYDYRDYSKISKKTKRSLKMKARQRQELLGR